jgi:CDP-paratose 2-epimerase
MTVTRLNGRVFAQPIVVTGGCGFLGSNLAAELARRGRNVLVLDNLSRDGARENAEWLSTQHGNRVTIEVADIRDEASIREPITEAAAVLHLAGQVAVTTSLEKPVEDFDINVRGTMNILETVRRFNASAPVIFASTNKVYGKLLEDEMVNRVDDRCAPNAARLASGVAEDAPLDFHSPYGCSKGAADQYVRDYARVFDLRTVVLRMSCIYGPRQFGTEDQGWIAHFLIQAIQGRPITIYGDGYQVRDALFVNDAVNAWIGALDRIGETSGRVFNLGGGSANSLSLRELLQLMNELQGRCPDVRFAPSRPGDQPWYVSDINTISRTLDWTPQTSLRDGLRALQEWLRSRFASSAPVIRLQEAQA